MYVYVDNLDYLLVIYIAFVSKIVIFTLLDGP